LTRDRGYPPRRRAGKIGAGSVIAQPFIGYAPENLNVDGIIDNPTAGTVRGGLTVLYAE
jgi:hypothetical protein